MTLFFLWMLTKHFYLGNCVLRSGQNVYPIYICKSTDGGYNWLEGDVLGVNGQKVSDKPWGCADLTNSIYRNNIYVTWAQYDTFQNPLCLIVPEFFSANRPMTGVTFSTPVRISTKAGIQGLPDSSNTMEGAMPCTGPNGEVYVSWAGPNILNSQYAIFFNKSTDGGKHGLITKLSPHCRRVDGVLPYPMFIVVMVSQ